MKQISLIGIGPGGPEYLTMQAIETMRRTDCFFLLEKAGRGKEELLAARHAILRRYLVDGSYRVVTAMSPPREMAADGYREGVVAWHGRKRDLFAGLIANELADGERGAFLIWGDPSLYDQTVSLIAGLVAADPEHLAFEIIPGITAVQMLTARHRIPLNRIGEAIRITTGRDVEHCDPARVDNAVVLLDYNASFQRFVGQDMEIYWGAYLGSPDEALIAGPLDEVLDELLALKARLREDKGWLMDSYLLRRRRQQDGDE